MTGMRVIGILGEKASGKSTVAKMLTKYLPCRLYAFADPLKELCQDVYCLPHECFYGDDDQKNKVVEELGVSGRHIMQYIGTEVFRTVDESTWINYLGRQIVALYEENKKPASWLHRLFGLRRRPVHAVIQDVRFPNEGALLIKFRNSLGLRVDIVYLTGRGVVAKDSHSSESSIKQTAVRSTVRIKNDGSLQLLEQRVRYHLLR